MSSLSVTDVSVSFDATAVVKMVSLEVPLGEVMAVLGPSGCGKSTLLRAIAGLEPLASGSISFEGADLAGTPTHKRGFALMFQDGQLFTHLTVAGNVGYPLRLRRTPQAQLNRRVAELLEMVGLEGYADREPATLSGGERQRVALARALAVRPRLLLLDEPLSALDGGLRERLAGELRTILQATKTTAVVVTHDHEEAFALADRLAMMRSGRVVQEGPISAVWQHPVDAEAAIFLGYARVLAGAAASQVLEAAGLPAGDVVQPSVALRRSALTVAADGPLRGIVTAARATPDQVRLTVEVDSLGLVDAVGPLSAGTLSVGREPATSTAVGARVRLAVDPAKLALVQPSLH